MPCLRKSSGLGPQTRRDAIRRLVVDEFDNFLHLFRTIRAINETSHKMTSSYIENIFDSLTRPLWITSIDSTACSSIVYGTTVVSLLSPTLFLLLVITIIVGGTCSHFY